jgi:hypothetical protein
MTDATYIQREAGASSCCDAAGRMVALAWNPLPLRTLVAVAVRRGEGTEAQVRERITDMVAGGYLLEL